MSKKFEKIGVHLLFTTLVVACLSSYISWTRGLLELENALWDVRVKLTANPHLADKSIKIITISQESLNHFAKDSITWPWPRPLYIPVIEFLREAGAKGLAFDMLFTETSVHGVADDAQFADAMYGDFPVISAVSLSNSNKDSLHVKNYNKFKDRQKAILKGFSLDKEAKRYPSATLPISQILDQASGFGTVNANPDIDGMFRRYPAGYFLDETPVLSLPFALYYAVKGNIPSEVISNLDESKTLLPRFYGPAKTYETIDIADVISSYVMIQEGKKPLIDPKTFNNSWVFLGVWAPGLLDLRPISLDEKYRGVEFLATVLDNLIHSKFISRNTRQNDALLSFVLAMLTGLVFFVSRSVSRQVVWAFIIITSYSLAAILLARAGVWIVYSVPTLSVLFLFASSLAIHYYHEGRQHKFLKEAFGHYVNKEVIKKIVSDPNQLSLGGEKRELTIFFSDVAGFTTISESMEPGELTSLLNEYLSEMTDIILASGGTLDKYEGDAIIAFWNAPLSVEDHELCGVRAALDCQNRLDDLRKSFESRYGVELRMRIGINTGEVVVGNFGSKDRFNYTMIGDAANLAARLEGVNKVFGTETLISEFTNSGLKEHVFTRKLGDIRVVGRKEPVSVFEPCDSSHVSDQEALVRFEECRLDFEKGSIDSARQGFKQISDDPVAKAYLLRIDSLNGDLDSDWSPVWNLTEK